MAIGTFSISSCKMSTLLQSCVHWIRSKYTKEGRKFLRRHILQNKYRLCLVLHGLSPEYHMNNDN